MESKLLPYFTNGFIHLKKVIRQEGIPIIRKELKNIENEDTEYNIAKLKIIKNKNTLSRIENLIFHPLFKQILDYPTLKEILRELFNGLELKFVNSTYINNKKEESWKQEQYDEFFPVCCVYMIIDNKDNELRFVNSSHEKGGVSEFKGGLLNKIQIDTYCSRYSTIVPEAGDIIISDPYIIKSFSKPGKSKFSVIKTYYA
jgi:hypothetical protein